jgi:hypothetical protein
MEKTKTLAVQRLAAGRHALLSKTQGGTKNGKNSDRSAAALGPLLRPLPTLDRPLSTVAVL